eukprot:jgi/Botrbrau1/11143/Bobra.331_1s0011.2
MGGLDSLFQAPQGRDKLSISLGCMHEAANRVKDPLRQYKFWSRDMQNGRQSFQAFHDMMKELLAEVKGKDARGELNPESIAGRLLRATDPVTGEPLDDDLLLPEFAVIFLGGFETMSHAMVWVLYCLSQHREVEAKLVAELASLGLLASSGNPQPRQVEWEDLPKLVYLEAVIKETLRLYHPAGGGFIRQASKDVSLGGHYTIPKSGAGGGFYG